MSFSNYNLPRFGTEDESQRIYLSKVLADIYGQLTTLSTSGAPADASYVVTAANAALTNASILTAGSNVSITSGATINVNSAPPSGAAGGDLTGSYPNPTVNIDGKTAKTTPVDADETFLADSAASFATKKLSWANIKATLKTYFDTLYSSIFTLTTTGTSGPATLSGGVLNIPQYSGGGGSLSVTNEINTTRTAVLGDNGALLNCTNASGCAITVPQNSSVAYPVGAVLQALQNAAGQVSFVAGTGTTFNSNADSYKTRKQGSTVGIVQVSANNWVSLGDMEFDLPACSILLNATNATAAPTGYALTSDQMVLQRMNGALVGATPWATDTGTVNALAAVIPCTGTFALQDGAMYRVRVANSNTSTAVTLALNGGSAITVKKNGNQSLLIGDLPAGLEAWFVYVSATPRFELINPFYVSTTGGGAETLIQRITVSGGAVASVHFASIPNTYKDLKLIYSGQDTNSATFGESIVYMAFNSDNTAANYTAGVFKGALATLGSTTTDNQGQAASTTAGGVSGVIPGVKNNANAVGCAEILIPNYAGSFHKIVSSTYTDIASTGPVVDVGRLGFVWKNTNPISDIVLTSGGTAFANGCTFALIGIG